MLTAIRTQWRRLPFRKKALRHLRQQVKVRRTEFSALRSLNSDMKQKMLRSIVASEIYVALTDLWLRRIMWTSLILFACLGIIFGLATGVFMAWEFMSAGISHVTALTRLLIAMITSVLAYSLTFAPVLLTTIFRHRKEKFLIVNRLSSVWSWLLILIYSVVVSQLVIRIGLNRPWLSKTDAINVGLATAVGVSLLAIAAFQLLSMLERIISNRVRNFWPEATVIHHLLRALVLVEKDTGGFYRTRGKAKLIYHLGVVAECLQKNVPESLRSRAQYKFSDGWLEDTFAQIASSITDLHKWVITPKIDTLGQLQIRLSSYIIYMIRGDWDSFDKAQVQAVSRSALLRSRLNLILTALVSASVPLITLWIVKRLDILTDPLITYLTVGGYIWSALTLLSHLDPHYGAKLTAIKDITQLLPFSKSKD